MVEVLRRKGRHPPQIEGRADTKIFSNLPADYEHWVGIRFVGADGRLILDGGQFLGLGRGSELAIRGPLDSEDPSTVMATGRIVKSDAQGAVMELIGPPPEDFDLRSGRAFVTRQSFGNLAPRILIDGSVDVVLARLIRDSLEARRDEILQLGDR